MDIADYSYPVFAPSFLASSALASALSLGNLRGEGERREITKGKRKDYLSRFKNFRKLSRGEFRISGEVFAFYSF